MTGDTIAAVATPPGRSGVAVVRVSGEGALDVALRVTGAAAPGPGRFALRTVRDPSRGGAPVDEAVVLSFRAPRSYTGEDVVEFQCHGGAVAPRRVLEACFAAGARLARRGEFTERALLNGRIDFRQAEAVIDLIDAKTDRAADAALAGLDGRDRRALAALYDDALDLSTRLEHALDVDEEALTESFREDVRRRAGELRGRVAGCIRMARERRILRDGALVVLAGRPNAGKSSLMNALLGEERVLVNEAPGTTRDSVEAWLDLDGWPVRLVDTAGLRSAADAVEADGVRRAEGLIARADVVLNLSPGDWPRAAAGAHVVPVHAKCDLGRGGDGVNVSAKTGEGLDDLRRAIVARLEAKTSETGFAGRAEEGLSAMMEAMGALESASWDDMVLAANAARDAATRLGAAIGAEYSADLLENLFSRFCVGK